MTRREAVLLADAALAALRRRGTGAGRARAAWYYPTRLEVFGVPAAAAREVQRALRRDLRGAPAAAVLAVARRLAASRSTAGLSAAFELLETRDDALDLLRPADLERFARGLDNWASVDGFGVSVAGRAWRRGRAPDALFRRWTRSPDRWRRRAALVATVPLNLRSRGGTGDAPRTLDLCLRLAADRDPMVAKALSWALRALSGPEPAAVRSFLARHGDALAPLVLREVRCKLATGRKSPSPVRAAVR